MCFKQILGMNDDDDLASELDQSSLGQQIQNLDASKQATCFHYMAAMPHRSLNPSMMLSTEPAMKAPCVALIACRNLWNAKGEKKSSFVINVSKARRHRKTETTEVQVEWRIPQVGGSRSVCYYKRWMICYLLRVRNVDDTRSIDDGKRDRQKIGVSHNYRQS